MKSNLNVFFPTLCSCDIRSLRQEEFTNLSLDLVPEATVEQILQLYLTVHPIASFKPCDKHTHVHMSSACVLSMQLFFLCVCEQESQLEYKCNCGGTESGQRFSFATLPE